ncbi:MAG: diguanylate cyclase, partial [Candidatus Thiodiazotropha sp.]
MSRYSNLSHSELERMLSESERSLRADTDTDTDYLLHNLQLHKIELEIQNRDLMESQKELESIRDQYAELYDFAPVGYLTLDKRGIIKNLNITAAGMFGMERSRILGKPLSLQLRQALSTDQKVTADFALKTTSDGMSQYVRADTIVHADIENEVYCLMNLIDTTERRRAEQAVIDERTFLQHVIDGVDNLIMVISLDFKVLRMNQAARRIAIMRQIDPEHACCYQVSHQIDQPCDSDDYPCPLKIVMQTRLPSKVVHNHISEFGTQRKYEVSVSPLFDDNGEIMGVIESSHDITEHLVLLDELKERQLSYAHLAQHDALTGLPNRLLFADRLSQAMHVAHRNKTKLAVMFIDLDNFKEVNDSFDHSCGDMVLKEAAERFQT